mgnify:CR=1 FL=1
MHQGRLSWMMDSPKTLFLLDATSPPWRTKVICLDPSMVAHVMTSLWAFHTLWVGPLTFLDVCPNSVLAEQHFFFFFIEFQFMAFTPDDSSLSSDQDTNQFLV